MAEFKYTLCSIDGSSEPLNEIIDEKGNTFLALRNIYWGDDPSKAGLEIRKYYNTPEGGERADKGVRFLTPEGPNTLVNTMVGLGFGSTTRILQGISGRDDFRSSLNSVLNPSDEFYSKEAEQNVYNPNVEDMINY